MDDLSWLKDRRFRQVIRREHDWLFTFDDETVLTAGCLWRLIEDGRLRLTSNDDGHLFGLPARIDAAAQVNDRISGARIVSVRLQKGTLDLDIAFESGDALQLIPDSSGYESWQVWNPGRAYEAVAAGGELVVVRDGTGREPT